MFLTKFVEKIKTHFMFSNVFFYENRAVLNNVENMAESDRPQMTI